VSSGGPAFSSLLGPWRMARHWPWVCSNNTYQDEKSKKNTLSSLTTDKPSRPDCLQVSSGGPAFSTLLGPWRMARHWPWVCSDGVLLPPPARFGARPASYPFPSQHHPRWETTSSRSIIIEPLTLRDTQEDTKEAAVRVSDLGRRLSDTTADDEVKGGEDEGERLRSWWWWVLEYDELSKAMRQGGALHGFLEGRLCFPPSFRWVPGAR
jgi:hypothetical protein